MLPDASYQEFAQKIYMGWKRCCLKNNKMAAKFLAIFDF